MIFKYILSDLLSKQLRFGCLSLWMFSMSLVYGTDRNLCSHLAIDPDSDGKSFGMMGVGEVSSKHCPPQWRTKSPVWTVASSMTWPHNLTGDESRVILDNLETSSCELSSVCALELTPFLFLGKKDIVRCFSCGGCIEKLVEGDDPIEEHTKLFPKWAKWLLLTVNMLQLLFPHCPCLTCGWSLPTLPFPHCPCRICGWSLPTLMFSLWRTHTYVFVPCLP